MSTNCKSRFIFTFVYVKFKNLYLSKGTIKNRRDTEIDSHLQSQLIWTNMPRKFNGERKMFSTNGTEINESPHEEKKKEKCLKKYHRPDDNGLVLDLSTDYRAGYLL